VQKSLSLILTFSLPYLAKESGAMEFMERITPIGDETIRTLAAVRFVEGPIAGVRYSRAICERAIGIKSGMTMFLRYRGRWTP
jgi:hypothetical protein